MEPGRAILLESLRTGQTWGRATRSEFWWLAPVGATPPILLGLRRPWLVMGRNGLWVFGLVGLAALPLPSAAARRLQDAGELAGKAFYLPGGLAMPRMGVHGLASIFTVPVVNRLLVLLVLLRPRGLAAAAVVAWTAAVAMLGSAAQVLGPLLLPPDRGPNRGGPARRRTFA